jgi:hypothetical protein
LKNLEICILLIIIFASTVHLTYASIPSTEKRIIIDGRIYQNGTFFIDRWDRVGGIPDIPLDNSGNVRVHYLDAYGSKIAETGFNYRAPCIINAVEHCLDFMPLSSVPVPDVKGVTKFEIILTSEVPKTPSETQKVESFSVPIDIVPIQNNNSEGMSIESIEFFRTLYYAGLVSKINESIQSLPDDAFFDSTNKADFQDILVSGNENIYDLYSKSNFFYFDPKENINNFYEATTRLSELKTRMDGSIGGSPSDDWIVEQNSQNQILEKIDFAIDEYLQSVGGDLKPVSVEDYDENWWSMIRMYQENAEGYLGYMCYSESLKKPPNNEHTQIHFEIPECQTFIPKSLSPIEQIRIGVPPEKIQCDEGLELIFKPSINSPKCVKPETKIKLIERGWVSS